MPAEVVSSIIIRHLNLESLSLTHVRAQGEKGWVKTKPWGSPFLVNCVRLQVVNNTRAAQFPLLSIKAKFILPTATASVMADRYLNYLLSKSPQRDSLLALSNSPFVAVGAEMQWIWQSVLRHRRNGQVVAVDGYPNLRCKFFIFDKDLGG
jgi:hypothetical protein